MQSSKKIFHANQVEIFETQIPNSHPYIVRSARNNGTKGYIIENKEFLNPANTLAFAQDTFCVFYQKEPYFTGNKIKILISKHKGFNAKNALFVSAIFQKVLQDFTWGINCTEDDIKKFTIQLPTYPNNEIAFDFMESYIKELEEERIKELEEERIKELETYLLAAGLKDTRLTPKEKEALHIFAKLLDSSGGGGGLDTLSLPLETHYCNNTLCFKEFRIGELFEIFTGRDVIIGNVENGDIPLISHQNTNNGVVKYIKKLEHRRLFNHTNTIALADRGVFYATTQNENFHIGTRVKALVFKDKNISKNARLFFVGAINKLQIKFTEYSENATDKLPNEKITLPVYADSNPSHKSNIAEVAQMKNRSFQGGGEGSLLNINDQADNAESTIYRCATTRDKSAFDFMESLIKAIEKAHIDKLNAFWERKLKAYQAVVENE